MAWFLVIHSDRALPILAALVLFLAFAGVSGFLWITGASGCGCYGPINLPLSATVVLDLGCVILLWLNRQINFVRQVAHESRILKSTVATRRGMTTLASGVFVLVSVPCLFGTEFGRELLRLPDCFRIVALESHVGAGPPKSSVLGHVTVNNASRVPARIVGANASCGCIRVSELPASIPANGAVLIAFWINRPSEAGAFHKVLTLYLDHPDQYLVQAAIDGQVVLAD